MRQKLIEGLLLSLVLSVSAYAQAQSVWKIGNFDNASEEFSLSAGKDATGLYNVSSSRAPNWIGTQQAVVPAQAATSSAAQRIQFELAGAPSGLYRLRIALILKTARAPIVQVDVNGHRGWFHQPLEKYREGNSEGAILPQYALGEINLIVPTEFLRAGANVIALLPVADPLSTALPGGETTDFAVLNYDALELLHDQTPSIATIAPGTSATIQAAIATTPTSRMVAGVTGAATPTVFFKREGGRLSEVVSVLVECRWFAPQGTVTLSLPGWSRTQPLAVSGRDFGDERVEFNVPEFAAGTHATVTVNTNGRDYTFPQTLAPARKWTVYMVPHEHLDVGYSDYQTKLAELHSRVINDALDMNAAHPEFRFTLDGYWQAKHFLEGRTEAERQKFYAAIREQKIFVPAQHSVILTGFPTGEALIRSFYNSHKLNRAAGGVWNAANITDVPSYSWSYASILAAAGIKYFGAAANADRGPTLMLGDLHRHSPFWWEGPDGARVLMWYSRHYHQIGSEFGLPTQVANGYEGLQSYLRVYERPDYAPRSVLLHGSQWENTALYPQQAALVKEWNNLFAYPELRYSGFGEAIGKIAAEAEGKLEVVRGDGGPFWEDGIASDAYHAAMERETERRAVSAEKLGTIASLVDPRFQASRAALDCMWENVSLMDEHTWGWGRSVTEPHSEDSTRELDTKRHYARTARQCMDYLLDRSMTAIAGRVETSSRALIVFNTLNWPRGGWVEFDLQKTRELVDLETRQTVAFDVLEDHPAYQRIRFMARDVPAVGYKAFDVRDKSAPLASTVNATSATAPAETVATTTNNVLENNFYRVTLDPQSGGVRSIYDKELRRELVDASGPYRFNQYVYVTGGDAPFSQLLTYRRHLPLATLEPHAATAGRIVSVTRTPTGMSARLENKGINTPKITTEIMLFDAEKRIEIINRVQKETIYQKEAAYFAFPLALSAPEFKYEVQNGVVNPAKDMIPGAGLEWFSSQNWVSAGEAANTGGAGVEVGLVGTDSFLWTFGDIVRGTWPTEFKPKSSTVFAYVMNNYWNTNYIAAQGGEFTFRYAVTSAAKLDGASMSRLGWEQTTPLERTLVKSQDKAAPTVNPLPASRQSFLQTSDSSVFLSAWKDAEDGAGSVLRFIELGGGASGGNGGSREVRVSSPLFGAFAKSACNAVEDCDKPVAGNAGNFNFETRPRQILTFKVTPAQLKK